MSASGFSCTPVAPISVICVVLIEEHFKFYWLRSLIWYDTSDKMYSESRKNRMGNTPKRGDSDARHCENKESRPTNEDPTKPTQRTCGTETDYTTQTQKAVSAHFKSEQILPLQIRGAPQSPWPHKTIMTLSSASFWCRGGRFPGDFDDYVSAAAVWGGNIIFYRES